MSTSVAQGRRYQIDESLGIGKTTAGKSTENLNNSRFVELKNEVIDLRVIITEVLQYNRVAVGIRLHRHLFEI
jgi:hypothetical protein